MPGSNAHITAQARPLSPQCFVLNRDRLLIFCILALFTLCATSGTASAQATYETLTVNAGEDQTVETGDEVTLSCEASSTEIAASLPISALSWSQQSGTTVTLSNPVGLSYQRTFTAPSSTGTLTFRCTYDDGTISLFDDMTVTVVVAAPANLAAIGDSGNRHPGDLGRRARPGCDRRYNG